MSSGCQVVVNQVPLYHLDATQTNPLPLRPKCGSILPMESHFSNYLPLCHWSATGYFSVPLSSPLTWDPAIQTIKGQPLYQFIANPVPLDCHCVVTQSRLYHSTNPVPLDSHCSGTQSIQCPVAVKWLLSDSQVVVK